MGLFLRKLAALGCVKQVKALDNITRPTLRYFRCIKFVREPGEADSQKLFGPGYGKIHLKATEEAEEIDSEDDDIDEYPDDQLAELTAARENPPTNDLKEVERLIPQWTGSGCVHYFIHDLVQRSGMQGMSTMVSNLFWYTIRTVLICFFRTSNAKHLVNSCKGPQSINSLGWLSVGKFRSPYIFVI